MKHIKLQKKQSLQEQQLSISILNFVLLNLQSVRKKKKSFAFLTLLLFFLSNKHQKIESSHLSFNYIESLLSMVPDLVDCYHSGLKPASYSMLAIFHLVQGEEILEYLQQLDNDQLVHQFWVQTMTFLTDFNNRLLTDDIPQARKILSLRIEYKVLKQLVKLICLKVENLRKNNEVDALGLIVFDINDKALCAIAINCLFELIQHPKLQLHLLPSAEKKALKSVYGDLRKEVLDLIIDICDTLDIDQFQFDNLIQHIVMLSTIDNRKIRKTAINLLYWLVENEVDLYHSISRTLSNTKECLQKIVDQTIVEKAVLKSKVVEEYTKKKKKSKIKSKKRLIASIVT